MLWALCTAAFCLEAIPFLLCYQEPSAILQLFAWSKAAWPGHGPSSPLGDAVLAAED